MSHIVLLLAALCGLACGSLAISAFVLLCGTAWDRDAGQRTDGSRQRCEVTSQTFKDALDGLAAKIQAVQRQQPMEIAPAPPRHGLSPPRRTQALRMHRRGESPEQIAAALGIPLAEVDLLLKAHRIVMSNI
jgi:hypothetical protein